jgi:glycosyltransferase involved in cell wall biosynthesis
MVYDARELETETNGLRGINQAFARRLERTFIPLCDAVLCVSDSIADWYAREYGICRPFVVRNVPAMQAQPTDAERRSLRERFRIPREALVFIYSGGLYKGRRIEQLLRAFQEARPNLHIVFMGFGPLEGMVRKASAASANIHFLPSIPPEEILSYTAGADIGVAAHLEPTCLNHRFALPNKFFEYLLAGVPVWVNDVHEEMAALVRRHGFGWVTRYDEGGVLEWVNGLSPGELQMKRELAAKASHCFSWEHEAKVFVTAYRQAMRGRDRSTSGPSWLL